MDITVNVGDVKLDDVIEGREIREYDEVSDDYSYRNVTLADLVAEKLADRVIKANNAYYKDVSTRVNKQIDALVKERVAPLIEEAIKKPVRKTNAYGELTGGETTMTELIIETARKWLEGTVQDGDGGYRNRKSNAQKLIEEAVGYALTKELSGVIATEREKVVNAVRAQASKLISEAVTKGVGGK